MNVTFVNRLLSKQTQLILIVVLGLIACLPAKSFAVDHYDFTYPDRASLLAGGWDFLAVTATGGVRNTEQTTGAVVSYDQTTHPGVLRIPADTGDLWGNLNSTRNSLFRNLPLNWTSIKLKLSFNPTQNYQQAGLLAYQDDDNYVQVTRIYENGNKATFANEYNANPNIVSSTTETATTGLYLRLDRDPAQEKISAYYSRDGVTWFSFGSVIQPLSNPRLAIVIGASPGGYPNADLAWAEIESTISGPPPGPPPAPVSVATWKEGHKGALSVSVDDAQASCFDQLTTYHFDGTYVMNGTVAPSFYTDYYNAGMELGSHLVDHICKSVSQNVLRQQEIVPSIQGICTTTPEPCQDVISLVWPCGYTNATEEAVASDYFLSARGYNINQLEDPTPADFFNLKSFNSHEHSPYPPSDLKTVVTMAEQQGKWANLVFHTSCDDDGAIAYSASRDIWVAPIGRVIKYILQRNSVTFKNYLQGTDSITFSFARAALRTSKIRSFETAVDSTDMVSLLVYVDASRQIASVRVNGAAYPYQVESIDGYTFVLIDTLVDTNYRAVEVKYQSSSPTAIVLSLANVSFSAMQGTNPANQTVALSNGGGGTMTWTAVADSAAPAWLSVSPGSGTGDATLTLSVTSAGLVPGTYSKTVTVAAPGAVNSPQPIYVDLTVAQNPATIALSPTTLSFIESQGNTPSGKTISVTNSGGGTLNWTATADSSAPAWLSVSPTSGTGGATITATVTSVGLSPGTYTKVITIAAPGATNSPQTVKVTLKINKKK